MKYTGKRALVCGMAKSGIAAIIISSLAAPVVNTGVFCLGIAGGDRAQDGGLYR